MFALWLRPAETLETSVSAIVEAQNQLANGLLQSRWQSSGQAPPILCHTHTSFPQTYQERMWDFWMFGFDESSLNRELQFDCIKMSLATLRIQSLSMYIYHLYSILYNMKSPLSNFCQDAAFRLPRISY